MIGAQEVQFACHIQRNGYTHYGLLIGAYLFGLHLAISYFYWKYLNQMHDFGNNTP